MARRGALLLAAVALLAPSPAYAAWGKKDAKDVKAEAKTVTTTTDSTASVVKSEQKYEEWSEFNTYWCVRRPSLVVLSQINLVGS